MIDKNNSYERNIQETKKEREKNISHNIQIYSPEKQFFNLEGKVQSLEEYLTPRLKVTEELMKQKFDLLEIINKPGNITLRSVDGNVYFDNDKTDDNMIGKFTGLFIQSSCPKLIQPKKIAETFMLYLSYTSEEIRTFREKYKKGEVPINFDENKSPIAFSKYIENARYRKEVREDVNNIYMHYIVLELKQSFYKYLEKFRVTKFR